MQSIKHKVNKAMKLLQNEKNIQHICMAAKGRNGLQCSNLNSSTNFQSCTNSRKKQKKDLLCKSKKSCNVTLESEKRLKA